MVSMSAATMTSPRKGKSRKSQAVKKDDDKRMVADLYVRGFPQSVIAERLGVHQPRISVLLSELRLEWKAAQLVDTNEKLLIELAKMDKLEQECWVAWDKSKEDGVTLKSTREKPWDRKDKKTGKLVEQPMKETGQEETRVGQCGDPSYLHVIEKCIVTRLKLMGLLNPKDTGGTNLTQVNINWGDLAKPIPSVEVIDVTPSKSIEDRIAAESNGARDGTQECD